MTYRFHHIIIHPGMWLWLQWIAVLAFVPLFMPTNLAEWLGMAFIYAAIALLPFAYKGEWMKNWQSVGEKTVRLLLVLSTVATFIIIVSHWPPAYKNQFNTFIPSLAAELCVLQLVVVHKTRLNPFYKISSLFIGLIPFAMSLERWWLIFAAIAFGVAYSQRITRLHRRLAVAAVLAFVFVLAPATLMFRTFLVGTLETDSARALAQEYVVGLKNTTFAIAAPELSSQLIREKAEAERRFLPDLLVSMNNTMPRFLNPEKEPLDPGLLVYQRLQNDLGGNPRSFPMNWTGYALWYGGFPALFSLAAFVAILGFLYEAIGQKCPPSLKGLLIFFALKHLFLQIHPQFYVADVLKFAFFYTFIGFIILATERRG